MHVDVESLHGGFLSAVGRGVEVVGGDQHWQAAVASSVRQAVPWQQFSVR